MPKIVAKTTYRLRSAHLYRNHSCFLLVQSPFIVSGSRCGFRAIYESQFISSFLFSLSLCPLHPPSFSCFSH